MSSQQTGDRTLGAVGVVAVVVLAHAVAVATSLEAPERVQVAHDVAGWAGALLGLFGTVAAARAFAPGDYLRTAWGLRALASFLLVVGVALRSYWLHFGPGTPFNDSALLPVRAVVVTAANLAAVAFLVLLVRTFKRSGLEPPSSWRTTALWALTALAAFSLSALHLRDSVAQLGAGGGATWVAVTGIASTLGDLTTVLLVVPLLRVAYLLRGGRLAWVWWTMAAAGGVYLVYDARELLAHALPGNPAHNLELVLVTRSLGLALIGLSGWMQREALAPQPGPAPRPSLDVSGAA